MFSGRHPDQYEIYHGEISHSGIMKFAQEIVSSNVFQVTPKNHKTLKDDGAEWFYDFSAPWCPPCRNFLPHIRYVSKTMANQYVKFAYVDCQAYQVDIIIAFLISKNYSESLSRIWSSIISNNKVFRIWCQGKSYRRRIWWWSSLGRYSRLLWRCQKSFRLVFVWQIMHQFG